MVDTPRPSRWPPNLQGRDPSESPSISFHARCADSTRLACSSYLENHAVGRRVNHGEATVFFGDPNLTVLEAADHVFEIGPRRKLDRKPAEARGARRSGSRAVTCPLVQTEMVMVSTRRDETHAGDMAHHVEADQGGVEAQRVVDVRHV